MISKILITLVALCIFNVRLAFCLNYSPLHVSHGTHKDLKIHNSRDEYKTHNEKLCPIPEDIVPCLCSFDAESSKLNLDCRAVTDAVQLRQVFQADFPDTAFTRLDMIGSPITVLPSGVFGNVTFENINFLLSSLEVVENGAFGGSVLTAKELDFQYCNIIQFPFESIKDFKVIHSIWLRGNNYSSVPSFESETLKWITLGSSYLTEMPEFLPNTLPLLEDIQLNDSPITSVKTGHFANLPSLKDLSFRWLELSGVMEAGSYAWGEDQTKVTWIDFFHNKYEKIEPGAIQFTEGMYIDIRFNLIDTLEEEVWRPLMEINGILEVQGLEILCDCSFAWIVTNPKFLHNVVDGFCADGTDFFDLDPNDFMDC